MTNKKRKRRPSGRAPAKPSRRPSTAASARRPLPWRWLLVGAALLLLAVIFLSRGDDRPKQPVVAAPLGTKTFEVSSRNHVQGKVQYAQTPPVGGDHNPRWMNCGSYASAIGTENGVHSMEHGAVWITYRPDLRQADIDRLRSVSDQPYVLISPWTDGPLPAPIVVSAWGAQLRAGQPEDPTIADFLRAFRQSASAPEPGAPCTGGLDQ